MIAALPLALIAVPLAAAIEADEPADHSISTVWVYATDDDTESAARVDFFGFTPPDTKIKEEVAGICARYAEKAAQ